MRIAAVGDLHCRADTRTAVAAALSGVDKAAECLLLAGDLTDHGTVEEASWLAEELAQLQRFGESVMKHFVDACIAEELKLENALFQLRTRARVALLHYAPSRATLEGEPLEIYPFLGATRLSGPLDQLRPALALHGHAHRGNLRGTTRGGVPVYNVALPVLRRLEKPVGFLTLDV